MQTINEFIVENSALEWFGALVYAIDHESHLVPGEPAAERGSFGEVVLTGRLREAIRRLSFSIPEEVRATIRNFRIVQITTGRETKP